LAQVWDPNRREFVDRPGAKIGTAFSAVVGDFVEIDTSRRRTAEQLRRGDNHMEDLIADEHLTLRQVAEIVGLHNSNVYRRLAGRLGRRHREVVLVWIANKAASLERANAARRLNWGGGNRA